MSIVCILTDVEPERKPFNNHDLFLKDPTTRLVRLPWARDFVVRVLIDCGTHHAPVSLIIEASSYDGCKLIWKSHPIVLEAFSGAGQFLVSS